MRLPRSDDVRPQLLVASALLAPALPLFGVALLALLFWLWRRAAGAPSRQERAVVALSFVLAGACLAARDVQLLAPRLRPAESWRLAAQDRYHVLLDRLAAEASRALDAVPQGERDDGRLVAFRRLADLHRRGAVDARTTLLLVDPDGDIVAWSGEGLRHDLPSDRLPESGFDFLASFRSVTLFAVQAAGEERRAWRVVAGRSFSTEQLPFPVPLGGPGSSYRWSLAPTSEALPEASGADRFVVQVEGAPPLVLQAVGSAVAAGGRSLARFAWLFLSLGLLILAALGALGLLVSSEPATAVRRSMMLLVSMLGAILVLAAAGGASMPAMAVLTAGVLATGVGVQWRAAVRSPWAPALFGILGVLLPLLIGFGYQSWRGPVDLASTFSVATSGLALRLGTLGLVIGLWAAPRRLGSGTRSEGWVWLALLLLLVAATMHDMAIASIPLLLAGGAAARRWGAARRPGLGGLAALTLVASVAAAGGWEISHRIAVERSLPRDVLPRLAPPSEAEVERLRTELDDFFATLDLADIYAGDPEQIWERQDLPLAIWERSPLARPGALSALVVLPGDGGAVSFSFGLPVDAESLDLDRDSERWPGPGPLAWAASSGLEGNAELTAAGLLWGQVRFWLIPRPGFGLERTGIDELEAGLLRGEPLAPVRASPLPGDARYALFDDTGRLLFSPWPESGGIGAQGLAAGDGELRVDHRRFRAWSLAGRERWRGVAVLALPRLTGRQALTRVGLHATGSLFVLSLACVAVALLALLRSEVRATLRRSLRSYSNRLIAVYTLLLVAPLLFLNLVLYRGMGQRLEEEQRAGGEAALQAAQRILGDYLPSLRPGFSVETMIDDGLLTWLSQVVRHEVNLYWRGYVNASSRPELFTAGLLPRRIPGEVYSRLGLREASVAGRTNRVGRSTTYLELYAPLGGPMVWPDPGQAASAGSLFLSVPLLAQQEELTAELVDTSRQALLLTVALFLLLVAVGGRLAQSFTTPLMEIVRGTGRIAAGETSLGLSPSEPELASLVAAIDDMAQRVAQGRSRLLREKRVIEGMVENITSGVVSVDRRRRVLMRNRVAADLLGLEVGEPIDRLVRSERFGPLADFLRDDGRGVRRATVRLPAARAEDSDDVAAELEWTLVWVPVPGDGNPAALLVVEDVTEVLRGQRLEAWAEMARLIAHDIKNPLTPIRLNTEHLQRVYSARPQRLDEVFERCTNNILEQVDELQQIAADFSTYSHIPRIDPQPGDLVSTIDSVTEGYRASPPPGVAITFEANPEHIPLRHDSRLLGRAVRNLVENSLRATSGTGEVAIRVAVSNGTASIAVADRGPGVPGEDLQRIFDPYFSTSSGGTGLGLPIARRIAEEHGGSIAARNRHRGGLEVTITMPLS